jgi:hypothetical protein
MRKIEEGKQVAGWTVIKPGQLEEELYTIYGDLLINGKTESKSLLAKLLTKDFKALETKETDNALKVITEIGKIAKNTSDYFNKKESQDTDFTEYLINKNMIPWQKEVIKDPSHKFTLFAGRRAGKSYVMAALMLLHCLTGTDVITLPDGRVVEKPRQAVYIGLTLDKARAVIWDLLITLIDKVRMSVKKIDNSASIIYFSNGSSIRLWGNNSKAEREKLRGLDCSMYLLDECQSQQGLLYIIDSCVGPIVRGRNGIIVTAGTAPLSAGTYWEEIINDETWSHYHATMADNPTIPNYEHALEEVLKDNNWTKDNIVFRREYLGELAYDTELLVYPTRTYETDTNHPKTNKFTECVIGLDFGFRDSTAIAPILIDEEGNGWLRHEFKQPGMSATQKVDTIKAKIKFIKDTYKLRDDQIYIFQDNSDLDIAKDLVDLGIQNVRCADKTKEDYQMQLVRDAIESGQLNCVKDSYFDQECDRVAFQWDTEHQRVIYKLDDATYHGDMVDAVRYAWYSYMRERHWEQSN